jgi:ankyrin repeat protein
MSYYDSPDYKIYEAAKNNNIKDIAQAISDGATERAIGKALLAAAEAGGLNAVQYLVEEGCANLNTKDDSDGKTALHMTANQRTLADKPTTAEVTAYWSDLKTGELKPNTNNHFMVADYLIIKGIDKEIGDEHGNTPLHTATYNGQNKMLEFFLERSLPIDADNNFGESALHVPAQRGYGSTVSLLLKKGANIDQQENGGKTPLHKAVWEGHVDIVKTLLEAGANPNTAENGRGFTPLHTVAMSNKQATAIISLLLKAKANMYALSTGDEKQTPLDVATRFGNHESAKVLREAQERQDRMNPGNER